MASNERYVSPYLLRPLRTLEQVLGGRGRAVEPDSFQGRQACNGRDALRETADRAHRPLPLRPAD